MAEPTAARLLEACTELNDMLEIRLAALLEGGSELAATLEGMLITLLEEAVAMEDEASDELMAMEEELISIEEELTAALLRLLEELVSGVPVQALSAPIIPIPIIFLFIVIMTNPLEGYQSPLNYGELEGQIKASH